MVFIRCGNFRVPASDTEWLGFPEQKLAVQRSWLVSYFHADQFSYQGKQITTVVSP
jgi:hypothetical protein